METSTTTAEIAILTAAPGFLLTDGSTAARQVVCPASRAALWREIPEAEWDGSPVPPDSDPLAPPDPIAKYEMLRALKALGLYDALVTAYTASPDLQLYWAGVKDLSPANADFQAFAARLATAEQLAALYAKIKELRKGDAIAE